MDLYLLRHGEAGKRLDDVEKDAKRDLTDEGREEVEEVAKSMRDLGIKLDVIITSPLTRAKETAKIVHKEYKKARFVEWDELKPTHDTKSVFPKLAKLRDDSRTLLVGHEPHMSSMIGEMIAGKKTDVNIDLKKSGLAKVEVTRFKPKINAQLRWLLVPKHLKKIRV